MIIDAKTGALKIGGYAVPPNISREKFLASSLGSLAQAGVLNKEWANYSLLVTEGEMTVGLIFQFKNDILINFSFTISEPSEQSVSWSTWSESSGHKAQKKAEAVLRSSLGTPPYEFAWGKASSEIDAKGGFAGGIISYS